MVIEKVNPIMAVESDFIFLSPGAKAVPGVSPRRLIVRVLKKKL